MTLDTAPLAPAAVPSIAIKRGIVAPPAASTDDVPEPRPDRTAPGLILFGRDERGRPHASRFVAAEAESAAHAAALMGLHTLVGTEAHQSLATSLPQGRLFKSGKAFVPFCSARMFADLLAAAGLRDAPPVKAANKAVEAPSAPTGGLGSGGAAGGAGGASKPPGDAALTDSWAGVTLGSVVLAKGDDEDGYYAAKVIATKANQNFVLTWVDYPDLLEFTRYRDDLGLLHPGPAPQVK
ncbi:hypothetical protein GOFOIKOB_1442 [Methylobacterium tardum]|uniref:Uncharacterized protein n=1 Tax=Methylobacterium tardum TaxID=374432 RepID=A0AA37TL89_9HYPH|nr:tudor domain-containing protein [Methylobacterium tardum]URD34581.1 tudor domain-containing protein [Methylobacterium tardum]GJE48413.1 hypothetical protein GOFOIKOB_1442 [Methylobacterium tardum]GLS73024.1 hypothetical protein GCM10007890_50390 [Methylobacterium tardum]